MSDLLRQLMRERQDSMAGVSREVDLDDTEGSIIQQLADAIQADEVSDAPVGRDEIIRQYLPFLTKGMPQQITDGQTLAPGMPDAQPMGPMIRSVTQLDR